MFGKMEVKGYWAMEGDYLVLEEKEKKDQFSDMPSFKVLQLSTYYYEVIEKTPQTMTLLLDLDKSLGIPKDLVQQPDTAFYKAVH